MTRHALSRIGLSLVALPAIGACGGSEPAGPVVYSVQYRLTLTGNVIFDSVKHDDGHGALVRVLNPANDWVVTLPVTSAGSAEAHAWGTAGPGSSAKLKQTWTLAGISTQADSSTIVASAPSPFALHVAKHTF